MKPYLIKIKMKYISLLVLLLVTISLNAQRRFSMGVFGGVGKTFNTETSYNSVTNPQSMLDYNYGLSMCIRVKDSSRLRLEGSIYRTALKYDWPSTSTLSKTVKNFYFMDLALRFDYKFLTYKNFDFYASPGVKGWFTMGNYEWTENTSDNTKTTRYIGYGNNKNLIAPSVQVLLRYKLNNHWGVTVAPEYSYFFKKLYYTCDGYMSQFDIKLGMECNF